MSSMQAGFAGVLQRATANARPFESVTPINPSLVDQHTIEFGLPIVFGDSSRPLAGRLHEVRGERIGAVVLCSPWGYEENCAFATFQLLAQRLAEKGIEALRFDYEGCGNSWGDYTAPDQLDRWVASCAHAVEFMSARTGRTVAVIGLRMGATLAALVSASLPLAATILWDPVVNGRRYLRALRAMSMMGVDAGPDPSQPGSLVAIGNYLTAATVSTIEGLDLQKIASARIENALIISRPATADSKRLAAALQTAGVAAEVEELPGTEKMLDCAAEQSVVPQAIVERIVAWLHSHPSGSLKCALALPQHAMLDNPNVNWTEEYISIGPQALNAVLTLPRHPRFAGAVVMTNNGVARAIGPARAWVEWSRIWAGLGIASLRFDLGGLGDSRPHPGRKPLVNYPVEAIDDIAAAVAELKRRGLAPAVAVGLCSGAFLSLDAAAADAGLCAVVGINTQTFYLPDPPGSPQRQRRAAPPTHPWVQRFLENTRVGRRLARLLPYPAWRLLDLSGLQPSPLRGADVARAKARILLIYGDDNTGFLCLRQRDRRNLRRWQKDGWLTVIPGLDHSMFAPQLRNIVEAQVRQFLTVSLPQLATNRTDAVNGTTASQSA
jgi:alpha-beta hydrolase superfamily lysophospholipase